MISVNTLKIISLCTLIATLPACTKKETKIAEPIKEQAIAQEVDYAVVDAEVETSQLPDFPAEK